VPKPFRPRVFPEPVAATTVLIELDHVQIAVPPGSADEARRFYGALVGLEELERPETMGGEGVWFRVGERELHLGTADEFVPARKAHPALRVASDDELDSLAERLEASGLELRWDRRLPGARRFYAADPWGNRIEFLARR
jgi:catechol 2,3-dioxygenase-like lactoylglutathione lyase family enzyme